MKNLFFISVALLALAGCGGADAGPAINDGTAKYTVGDYKGALADYEKAISIDPNNAGGFSGKAMTETEMGDYENAVKDWEAYIQLKPDASVAYWSMGDIKLMHLNDSKSALADFNKAIELDANNAGNYVSRAQAKMNLEDLKGALEDCNKSVSLNDSKTTASALQIRGIVKSKMEDYAGAIEDFQVVIATNPHSGDAYLCMGIAKIQLSDESACEDLIKARDLGTDNAAELLSQYCH